MRGSRVVGTEGWVTGLGWFSIGLGAAELLAPAGVERFVGVKGHRGLLRWLGFREIAAGIGIWSQARPAGWLLGRVAGDAMDLALLGAAMREPESRRGRLAFATAIVAGATAVDALCAMQLSRSDGVMRRGIHVTKTIIIDRSPEDLYSFWHDFERLPEFMYHLYSVRRIDDLHSHWVTRGVRGMRFEWDAKIITDKPNEVIAWRSMKGADVDQAGSVRFEKAAGGRGTLVKVEIKYSPPAGILGAQIATLMGEAPEQQIAQELRRFKQLMETGEIARTKGQPAGRPRSVSRKYDELVRK